MKKISRILAMLLTLAMLLSLAPMAFAADNATVTLVTPAGSTKVTVPINGTFTFPGCDEEYEGYLFECWVTQRYVKTDGSDLVGYHYEGDEITIGADMTFYALYASGEFVAYDELCYYWSGTREDYTGLWALIGFNYDAGIEDYDYENPIALGEKGEEVDLFNDLGIAYDSEHYEFYTDDLSIQFDIERQLNGTYTIKNTKSGKYLSVSDKSLAMLATRDATSYWNITLDQYNCEMLSNASNSDLVLYYDDENCCFAIFDNTEPLFEGTDGPVYPSDYFYLNFFACAEGEWATDYFTTEIDVESTCRHTNTEVRGAKAATCTENGYTGDTYCKDCGEKLATGTVIVAKGHSFGAWTVTKAATATDKGVETRTCSVCGATENRDIPALGEEKPVYGECHFDDFSDCKDKWYHEAVDFTVENGLMNGVGNGKFDPSGSMTRAMIVTVLYRQAGEPNVKGPSTFTDVPTGVWYSDAIAWAQEFGIVNGVSDTEFAPEASVTREQIATILWRFEASPEKEADLTSFKDAAKISGYAVKAMTWAVSVGILNGDNGNLKPLDNATRAEFACMIMRFLGGSYSCAALEK
ncbi:MAG: S-layer homology domain-containing protein [Faecousia sp.]